MSGRGRGRGRGSGPMSQSKLLLKRSAQEAGLDNDREMMAMQEIVRPSLYPDIVWHSSGNPMESMHPASSNSFVKREEEPDQTQEIVIAKRPANVIFMIQKQRQLFEALNKSSHFVQQNPMTEVARYGQQTIRTAPDQNLLLSMSGHQGIHPINNNDDDDEHESEAEIPLVVSSMNCQKVYSKLATDERYFPAELLSTRKQLESARDARNLQRKTLTDLLAEEEKTQTAEDQDEDEDLGLEELEDLDEDEVEDYTTNYYDSDGEISDDGDGDGEATF